MAFERDQQNRSSHPTRELHCACLTLKKSSPTNILLIFLSIPLADLPLPASSAAALAERIAAEYGLAARAQTDERSLEVWLSRLPPSGEPVRSQPLRLGDRSENLDGSDARASRRTDGLGDGTDGYGPAD